MINNIIDEIQKSNNIVLLCHINTDGDAIGSTLAMYHAIKKLGKDVDVVLSNPPKRESFIEGYNDIKESSDKNYDLCIVLDTANIDRIDSPYILKQSKKVIVVDHHMVNTKYGDVNFVEKAPACCQIVYDIISKMNVKLDSLIAIPLTTGLMTDTGGLSHNDVTSKTYEVAYELSKIIDVAEINRKVLGKITKSQFELKKLTIKNLEMYMDGQIAFSNVTYEDIKRVGATPEECDILVNIAREIEGVELSILARNYEDITRISLRSSNIDTNKLASNFGGGGHYNASGIVIDTKDYQYVKERLINLAKEQINEWNISSK